MRLLLTNGPDPSVELLLDVARPIKVPARLGGTDHAHDGLVIAEPAEEMPHEQRLAPWEHEYQRGAAALRLSADEQPSGRLLEPRCGDVRSLRCYCGAAFDEG